MNYREERAHDLLLISLAEELSTLNRLDLLGEAFGVHELDRLERSQCRKPFDVELTFSNVSLVIETKVDSDESYRWNAPWQTERIVTTAQSLPYLKSAKHFLFLTYGTAEYYTKPYHRGPASSAFRHITLDVLAALVTAALKLPLGRRERYETWLAAMAIEQDKRAHAVELLQTFAAFREQYLLRHGDVDFPNNRFTFCAPELAFPVFHQLATAWNTHPNFAGVFGRVAIYPVPRMSPPVHDSILNFWELWENGSPEVGRNLPDKAGSFYFEINEDFNLNLKFDAELLMDSLRTEVWRRLQGIRWPVGVQEGQARQYKQSTYVLYEWDFGLLRNLGSYERAAQNLFSVIEGAVQALA